MSNVEELERTKAPCPVHTDNYQPIKPRFDYRHMSLQEAIRVLEATEEILEWKTYFVEQVGKEDKEFVSPNPERVANMRIKQVLGAIAFNNYKIYKKWYKALPELENTAP